MKAYWMFAAVGLGGHGHRAVQGVGEGDEARRALAAFGQGVERLLGRLDLIAGILRDEGFETRVASDSDGALAAIRTRRPQLLVLDIWLQGSKLDGMQVLDTVKREQPDLPVVMISGNHDAESLALRNMGVPDFNIAASVSMVTAQRLVRRLCHCKQPLNVTSDILRAAGFCDDALAARWQPFAAVGCRDGGHRP